ncbi:MAG: hypothetical protein ABSF83_01370 [Nitrososphaerales archaeon]|jgi:hypothetical protein
MASLFAYVFWHWPRPEIPADVYEAKLASFLRTLRSSSRPSGLVDVLSFRVAGPLPWGPQHGSLYEDWYVAESFAALGALNDAAVSGEARGPHDSVARDYMKGAGGILRSLSGDLPLRDARFATWVEKPAGTTYQSFYDEVAAITGGDGKKETGGRRRRTDLWRRQMVLGPSSQFCVHGDGRIQFPASLRPIGSEIEPLKTD